MALSYGPLGLLLLLLAVTFATKDKDITTRIHGGQDAEPGRYAYMVSLQRARTLRHFCGGTLIAPDVVLSAAHCVIQESTESIAVRTRPYRLNDPLELSEILPVSDMVLHPEYDPFEERNDVVLIKLNRTSLNQPIVQLNTDPNLPVDGQYLTQLGWGRTNAEFVSSLPDVLQVLEGSVYIENDVCWTKFTFPTESLISEDMLCTLEGEGEGVCRGDSGGPVVIPGTSPQEDIQAGITSFGESDCGRVDRASVFSRVSWNFAFIRKVVCSLSELPPAYFDCSGLPQTSAPSQATPAPSELVPTLATSTSLAPSGEQVLVTVALSLGYAPESVGWGIETLCGRVLHEVELGQYMDPLTLVTETVPVPLGEILNLVVTDELGIGLFPLDGSYSVIVFLGDRYDVTKMICKIGHWSWSQVKTSFTASNEGIYPTDATTYPTMTPSQSFSPTQRAPDMNQMLVNITIVIDFDTYSVETSWLIKQNNSVVSSGGPYSAFVGSNVTHTISLLGNETYVLDILDSEGDGLCCDNGFGAFFIYLGASQLSGQLLVYDNGDFSFESSHTFTTSLNSTFSLTVAPTSTPSVTALPTRTMAPTGGSFFATVVIFLDFYFYETSWAIRDAADETILYEAFAEFPFAPLRETVELQSEKEYIFLIYDSFGDGLCCDDGFGVVLAGNDTAFSEDVVLAYIPGDFRDVASAPFTASLDAVIDDFVDPREANDDVLLTPTFSPTKRPIRIPSAFPSVAPTVTGLPSSTSQTEVLIELSSFYRRYDYAIRIETADTRWKVFAIDFDSGSSSRDWNAVILLDTGREYLFTITDESGFGTANCFIFLGNTKDIHHAILAIEDRFAYVRKQFFVASEDGLLGLTLPTHSPSRPPSSEPSITLSPSSAPSISARPTMMPSKSSSPTSTHAPSGAPVHLLVLIQLDEFPEETGWTIMRVDDDTIAKRVYPFQYYQMQFDLVSETVLVEYGVEYTITFDDLGGDGFCCLWGQGSALIYLGVHPDPQNILVYESGEFELTKQQTFVVSSENVLVVSPSTSNAPSIAPSAREASGTPTTSPLVTTSPTVVPKGDKKKKKKAKKKNKGKVDDKMKKKKNNNNDKTNKKATKKKEKQDNSKKGK